VVTVDERGELPFDGSLVLVIRKLMGIQDCDYQYVENKPGSPLLEWGLVDDRQKNMSHKKKNLK